VNKLTNSADFKPVAHQGSQGQSAKQQADWNYEVAVRDVEQTISRIESGELELADVFEQFSQAVEQLRQCETFLSQRQQQADLLIEMLSDEQEF
jgi:exodeoxyribonuclease VII small subunit